ncbi:MAG: IPT/TIG domain-containing protein, partial [Promethearchaeia archaeon]
MVSNTRASLITVLGANFLQGLVCRFLAKHAAAPPATNASAHPQLLAGVATLINTSALVCRVPPLPDDSIGIYLFQLTANGQQWTTGKTRCFAGGAAGASNTSANSSTVNGTNSTSSLEPCSEDGEYLTVYSVPRVSRIFPSTGPSRGSLPISVHGVQFQQFTAMPALKCVYNQSSRAPPIISAARVVSDSLIVCSPLGNFLSASVTRHSVQITPDDDIFSQASMEFAYYGAEAVFPRSVPETGGFQVTVAGVHFTGATPNGVVCRFSAFNASAGGYMHTLVQGDIVQILARDAGNEFIKMSAVVCTTPDAASLGIRRGGSNVTLDVSLHGDQGFTSNNLTLTLYPLPRLFAAHPSFSS